MPSASCALAARVAAQESGAFVEQGALRKRGRVAQRRSQPLEILGVRNIVRDALGRPEPAEGSRRPPAARDERPGGEGRQIVWSTTVAAVMAMMPQIARRLANMIALRLPRSGYCASSGVSAGANTEM